MPANVNFHSQSRSIFVALALTVFSVAMYAVPPVEFRFRVDSNGENPFARLIWAEVKEPSGEWLNLPAFYAGDDRYAVRARAAARGVYVLGKITEEKSGAVGPVAAKIDGPANIEVMGSVARQGVRIDARDPRRFALGSGERFDPFGMNLAWPDATGIEFYHDSFGKMAGAGLNWARVWMAHWGGMNLEWMRKGQGTSPKDGFYDQGVAAAWDHIFGWAEDDGVYVQLVLQHHGQYSSQVNSNWEENPWNAANGGFLKSPEEFFTSAEAIARTKAKYRYVLARWAYSPAVMAWELFNEVHWVDAMRGAHANEDTVAKWHSDMAAYLRSLDRYHHLVTTSTEDLRSPLYSTLDYFQPHNYAPDLFAATRFFAVPPAELGKPVFYGEVGDDHLPLTDEEKKSGISIVPPVWASLMGPGFYVAQPWVGWDLLKSGRLKEMAACARFAKAVAHVDRDTLHGFSSVVECSHQVPFSLVAGYSWQKRPEPDIDLPVDGRVPEDFARTPRIFMNATEAKTSGIGSRGTYHVDLPREVSFALQVAPSQDGGGSLRVSVDGNEAVAEAWPKPVSPEQKVPERRDFTFKVPAGKHVLRIESPGANGWFDLQRFGADVVVPVLACIGRRSGDFVMAWLWHREGVYSLSGVTPETGTVMLDDLPAGTWKVTWWDSVTGTPAEPKMIKHQGGALRLPTPPISRHAAFTAERLKS